MKHKYRFPSEFKKKWNTIFYVFDLRLFFRPKLNDTNICPTTYHFMPEICTNTNDDDAFGINEVQHGYCCFLKACENTQKRKYKQTGIGQLRFFNH